MEKIELARKIYAAFQKGGITVVFYPTKVRAASEFQRQADQLAKDHEAIGLSAGALAVGAAMPIAAKSVREMLGNLDTAIAALLLEFPDITGPVCLPVKVKNLVILTHGTPDQLQAGTVKDNANQWIKNSLPDWVKAVAPFLAPKCKLIMFACSTAGEEAEKDPFTGRLCRLLTDELTALYGKEAVSVETWGHRDVGHTTANNRLVRFTGNTTPVGRADFLKIHGGWMAYFLGQNQNGSSTEAAQKELLAKCEKAAFRVYTGRDHDEQKDPINNYIRSIPFIGIDRVWTDVVTNAQPDYSYLGISEEAHKRVQQGLLTFQERFTKEWTALSPKPT